MKVRALRCSSCGNGFRGKQCHQHDNGFGTCSTCQKLEDIEANKILDKAVQLIAGALSEKKRKEFLSMPIETQYLVAQQSIADGHVKFC